MKKNRKQQTLEPTWIEQEEARRERDDRHALKKTGQGCLFLILLILALTVLVVLSL